MHCLPTWRPFMFYILTYLNQYRYVIDMIFSLSSPALHGLDGTFQLSMESTKRT